MTDKYKDWIVRYYANHDDIPEGLSDGHIVRELIRCKNCVKSQYDFMTKGYWCDGKQVSEHHYCGYAERKPDDA